MLRFLPSFVVVVTSITLLFAFVSPAHGAPCPASTAGETDITGEGTVFASTVYPGYPVALAVDCDTATSWFSTGPEPNNQPTIFRWTGAHEDRITTVYVKSNGDHPEFPTDFGFGSVTVRVRNGAGTIVFEQQFDLPGTPDPDVILHPNVVGQVVELLYAGHESNDCGGLGEVRIFADRTPPTQAPPTAKPVPPKPTVIPPTALAAPGEILISDTFDVPDGSLCDLHVANNGLGGERKIYYLPIFPTGGTDADHPIGANIVAGALENNGLDFGGFQFALSPPCAAPRGTIRGADMGQDLNIISDLLVPTNAAGLITQAGPYVRSRAAAPGDGIIGGESAGYWVVLESTGEIRVKRLNPWADIASSGKPAAFDSSATHVLEIAAGANQLQVALDGKLQTFNQDDHLVTGLVLSPTAGSNDGTAGIAFGAEANRGKIGGQRADNIIVKAYRPLSGLPVQNNFALPNPPTPTVVPTSTSTNAPTLTPAPSPVPPTGNPGANANPTVVASSSAGTGNSITDASNAVSGDCNNDRKLNEVDALCALEMSVNLRTSLPQMDMDGDGSVTSRDALMILQKGVGE